MKGNLQSRLEKLESLGAPPRDAVCVVIREEWESAENAIERAWATMSKEGKSPPMCWVVGDELDAMA